LFVIIDGFAGNWVVIMADQSHADHSQSGQTTVVEPPQAPRSPEGNGGGTAVRTKPRTAPPRVDRLPQWKVLLHNDSHNEMGYVVETIIELIAVNPVQALLHTLEAHKSGLALLITTHRERAELLCEQFASKRLTVTIEPDR
jgi:ATP-dependent Clp protease adapter protein ClpS